MAVSSLLLSSANPKPLLYSCAPLVRRVSKPKRGAPRPESFYVPLLLLLLPVLHRGEPVVLLEETVEMLHVLIAHLRGHGLHGLIRLP